jgi:release factor glutamine methyltransferase
MVKSITTIEAALAWGMRKLAEMDTPKLDAQVLLAFHLQQPRVYLLTWPEHRLETSVWLAYQAAVMRRQQGEPIAYILGKKEFWSLEFAVEPCTLIPRPATEILVQAVLDSSGLEPIKLLDLGTGTGAIACALASERPNWDIWGADKIPEVVTLARKNQKALNLSNVHFVQSDWFSELAHHRFDIIASNPPYIDSNDAHLVASDVAFEPRSALVAKDKGMADLDEIIMNSRAYLNRGGHLFLEHGYQQAAKVEASMLAAGMIAVQTIADLDGHGRVTYGQWLG